MSLPSEEPGARAVVYPRGGQKRTLTWAYIYNLQFDAGLPEGAMMSEVTGMRYYCSIAELYREKRPQILAQVHGCLGAGLPFSWRW